jgi:Zn-dependent protease
MPSGGQGSIRLFRFAGVDVFLHWSWFLIAVFQISTMKERYSSLVWSVLEYLALFFIVLLHEYGHVLACQQVGGRASKIVLWPLGGVAHVDPPPRPGATLWSLAAGPLVNLVLLAIVFTTYLLIKLVGWDKAMPNFSEFMLMMAAINAVLLIFNLLPIYPLDGGQILRALLWFVIGRARSLMVATLIGFVGVAGLIYYALQRASTWYFVMSLFILLNCWGGLKHSFLLLRLARLPHRDGLACPSCQAPPPMGDLWTCTACRTLFDVFATQAVCPYCSTEVDETAARCMECGRFHPINDWAVPTLAARAS